MADETTQGTIDRQMLDIFRDLLKQHVELRIQFEALRNTVLAHGVSASDFAAQLTKTRAEWKPQTDALAAPPTPSVDAQVLAFLRAYKGPVQ